MNTAADILLRNACRIHTSLSVHRYLMSMTEGRCSGAEKAFAHEALCTFYVAAFAGLDEPDLARRFHEPAYKALHRATQEQLTDHLDERIGFPLKGRPDLEQLAPKFFELFHTIALTTLSEHFPQAAVTAAET